MWNFLLMQEATIIVENSFGHQGICLGQLIAYVSWPLQITWFCGYNGAKEMKREIVLLCIKLIDILCISLYMKCLRMFLIRLIKHYERQDDLDLKNEQFIYLAHLLNSSSWFNKVWLIKSKACVEQFATFLAHWLQQEFHMYFPQWYSHTVLSCGTNSLKIYFVLNGTYNMCIFGCFNWKKTVGRHFLNI